MMISIENLKVFIKIFKISKFSKVVRCKVCMQKFILFLYYNKKYIEIYILKRKFLGINLVFLVQEMYVENYKMLRKRV